MLRKRIGWVSVVFVFGFYGSMAAGQENQIVNGEFDDALTSWNNYGAAGFTLGVVQGTGLSGKNALQIDVTDASVTTAIGIAQGGLGLVQGQTYQIGFTAMAEQEREMVVLFQIYKPIPQYLTPWEVTVQLTTSPQDFNFEYTHGTETTTEQPDWSVDIYLILKGTYWPMNGDDLNKKVWIDRVYFGAETPRQHVGGATDPEPADGAVHEDTWVTLRWTPGDFAAMHDVYLGDNFDDVDNGTSGTFRGRQSASNFLAGFPGFTYPEGLIPGTTYYWRVDEVNDLHPDSPWRGPVWSFLVPPRKAYAPNPANGVKFVDPDVTLSWTAGFGTKLHYVYFGDNAADVEAGADDTYKGPSVDPFFAVGVLERERTYYWRVDEFDGAVTYAGDLWSFTVAREGGGLKAEYFNNATLAGEPVLVREDPEIDFDWGNGDVPGENSPDASINVDNFSARWSGELEIDLTDTYTFNVIANNGFRLWLDGRLVIDFWDNPGTNSRASEPIELIGGSSSSIRMEYFESAGIAIAQLFWESGARDQQIIPQAALSPPIKANTPSPASGATGVPRELVLTWGPGDFAASHEVYFGTDPEAIRNATTASPEFKATKGLGNESYDPGPLAWGTMYYWRVDEVSDTHPDSPWVGNLWNFTTADFLVVDDFEGYTDDDAAGEAIWQSWIDGFGIANNGAQVGYLLPPYAEQAIVHGGLQSMPLLYANEAGVTNSEAALTLTTRRDWTEEGVGELSLWFQGDPANVPQGLYVAVANSAGAPAVVAYEDPAAATIDVWTEWIVPLQAFSDQGINLANVDAIAIGLGSKADPAAGGGSGTIYVDDIRLYRLRSD
jgi:hypothetical protein